MRQTALALGAVATVAMWYLAGDESPLLVLALSAYVFSPWGFLAFRARALADRARVIALAVLAAMTVSTYAIVMADDSSTAVLAAVFLPAYQWAAVGAVALMVQRRSGA